MRRANKTRGEVALQLNGYDLILCAEMERLEQLEQACDGRPLGQLVGDLDMMSVSTLKACIGALTIEGDAKQAWESQTGVNYLPLLKEAITAALFPELSEGKGEAEVESL
ncbi:hypothetical protein PsW64_05211 [Pseudovibrio sp. W64]|uniref:hypothetical protein n=1 Tax=Pseudovibrio sp. W64 TaxID=1735583 RepID=UPI0007AEAE7C|nr:hypothetical protein [Pseudovibrio sp. W64]KZK76482.1 hypothetical protein PsW64_05211 [Pseudovibrio sp. W64]